MTYIEHLETIAEADVVQLRKKDAAYGGSWLKRGGVGAFMMLARKWDRIEQQVQRPDVQVYLGNGMCKIADKWDILEHARAGDHPDGLLDDIRDLRAYLLLVEAELTASGVVAELENPDATLA